MWAIASLARRRALEIGWVAFSFANLAVMLVWPRWETVPFHFIWVSVTLLYGSRVWSPRSTAVVLAAIMLTTGAVIIRDTVVLAENADEITEVPLMSAMFIAMVWHARRRKAATDEVQRLVERERAMRESEHSFIRAASHELRTPITVARGHAELAARQQGDPQAAEDLEIVIDELDRLSTLSARLLVLAAADSPDFLTRRLVDVASLVDGVARRWAPTVDREWDVETTGAAFVAADTARLESALDALVENAVAFTKAGDSITLITSANEREVAIAVADTGIGIPAEQLERIFDPFARVGFGRDPDTGGTGLGLAIAKAIAEAHGGRVEITSGVGVGTTVTILLPAGREERPVPSPVDALLARLNVASTVAADSAR